MDDTVVFLVPLLAEMIVARADSPRGTLEHALSGLWGRDLVEEWAAWSCDKRVPWRKRLSASEMLFNLSPVTYDASGVACHLLAAEANVTWEDAWTFWRCNDPDTGNEVEIAVLRQRYLEKKKE